MAAATDPRRSYSFFFVVLHKEAASEVAAVHPPGASLLKQHPSILKFVAPEATAEAFQGSLRFTFALTVSTGQLEYGFCLRATVPPNRPASLCLLSPFPWFEFFAKALIVARQEYLSGGSMSFMQALYNTKPPPPGGSVTLPSGSIHHTLHRPSDELPLLGSGLPHLFGAFGVGTTLTLLGCLLEERRLLLCGDNLEAVSACAFSLAALLTPFRWQNPFIPVLPHGMTDVLCAPFPFLIGTHVDNLKGLENLPTEQIVVADVRSGRFVGAEDRIRLPGFGTLEAVLQKHLGKREKDGKSPADLEFTLRLCLVDFFVSMLGKYRAHMYSLADDTIAWNEEQFLQYLKTKGGRLHDFVDVLRKTQIFDAWRRAIVNEENGVDYDDEYQAKFMERCAVRYPDLHDGVRKKKKWGNAMWKSIKKGGTSVIKQGLTNSKMIANRANKAALMKHLDQLTQLQFRADSADSEASLTCPRKLNPEESEAPFEVLHLMLAPLSSGGALQPEVTVPVSLDMTEDAEPHDAPGFFVDMADDKETFAIPQDSQGVRLGEFLQFSHRPVPQGVAATGAAWPLGEADLFGFSPPRGASPAPGVDGVDLFRAVPSTDFQSPRSPAPGPPGSPPDFFGAPLFAAPATAPSAALASSPPDLFAASPLAGPAKPSGPAPVPPSDFPDLFGTGDLFGSASPVPPKPVAPAPAVPIDLFATNAFPGSPARPAAADPFDPGLFPSGPLVPPAAAVPLDLFAIETAHPGPKLAATVPKAPAAPGPRPVSPDLFGPADPFPGAPPARPPPPKLPGPAAEVDLFGAFDPFAGGSGAPSVASTKSAAVPLAGAPAKPSAPDPFFADLFAPLPGPPPGPSAPHPPHAPNWEPF